MNEFNWVKSLNNRLHSIRISPQKRPEYFHCEIKANKCLLLGIPIAFNAKSADKAEMFREITWDNP